MITMTQITQHGKIRMRERIHSHQRKITLFNLAKKYGYTAQNFIPPLSHYLQSKAEGKKKKVKIYQNNVYIYSKNTKKLITVFPVPEKYQPINQYFISQPNPKITQRKVMFAEISKDLENIVLTIPKAD